MNVAITIDWPTKVISVPKADLTLIQLTPTEIRELNIDTFRLILRSLESGEGGVLWLHTHDHAAPVSVGGVTLARVVELVNGYTITFEDGQYAVNIVGGNSNIGDNVNVNQVSVRSANSAGLISNEAIEFSSFNGGVTLKTTSGFAGTTFPVGTLQNPVNNLADAKLIADVRGFDRLYIIGDITFESTDDINGYSVFGNHVKTIFTCNNPICQDTEFCDATVTGTLNGGNQKIRRCEILNLINFSGLIRDSVLRGTIVLNGTETVDILNCFSGVPGTGIPVIDMGGSGRGLGLRAYSGGIKIINFTDSSKKISIDFISGRLKMDATVTAGTILVRGTGVIVQNDGTATVNDSGLTSPGAVWDVTMADYLTDGTTGKKLYDGGTGDTAAIAAAVWDMVLYPDHMTDDTAGKYIYEFYKLVEAGDVYVSTSTSSEILMVRERLGDAGVLITETVIDEEAISTNTTAVFPAERLIYEVSGIWLTSDPTHSGTDYYDGVNGEVDTYTGKIIPHTSFPSANTEVLINYTFMRGLPNTVIDQFLVEAKLYVKKYTRKDYDWSLGLGADPDEETQIALMAACSIAAMRCLEVIATGDILQFGYNFRLGDLQVESMTSGGFHVQAHIDFLKSDVERKLAMLGRAMHFVARTTRRWGRDAHGYKRHTGGKRSVY